MDGFFIGSNDLAQLMLGVDGDWDKGMQGGDPRTGPSDSPEFAEFLLREGMDSISLNPDSVLEVKRRASWLEESLSTRD